jgi:maleylpyruvate isomerase
MKSPAREWMARSEKIFSRALEAMPDTALGQPSGLPGWTGKHVVAHVHFNALALGRLAHWAATGEVTPMYASVAQRAAEIADGAQWPAARLRALAGESSAALAAALDGLDGDGWAREVVTIQGRRIRATELPWLRTRETAVHAVDLGAAFADLPKDLLLALAADVLARRAAAGELAGITSWLTGRSAQAPAIGPWL